MWRAFAAGSLAFVCLAGAGVPAYAQSAVVGVVSGTVGYTIDADVLTLKSGDKGLTFRAANCPHCLP